jgi:hypothetical protein
MSEDEKPTKTGGSSVGENTTELTFGDKKCVIKRLRAGRFYEAVKVCMDILKELSPPVSTEGKGEATVDLEKLVVSMFQTWPEKMIKFISICCSTAEGEQITEEEIKNNSYPEQVTEAFRTCFKLNRVGENIKNSVAPIQELGAELQVKQ